MALVESNMIPLGTQAPDFSLIDAISGQTVKRDDCRSEIATVVMFICNHCPYVQHIQAGLVAFAEDYQSKGVNIVAISANDATEYPEDGPDQMARVAKEQGYTFPYLYDESQTVAKAYQAACTPDFYVFNQDFTCVYRGRFDGATPGNDILVTGEDLRAAVDALLAGQPVDPAQTPSMGCSIKWQ